MTQTSTRFWISIALAAAFGLGVAAPDARAQPAKPLDKVTVATQGVQFTYATYYIAKLAGFFAQEGIETSETSQNATGISIASVISGDTPFGLGPTSDLMLAAAKRQPVRIVARVITGFPNLIVLRTPIAEDVAKTMGITPKSPVVDRARALKGKSMVVVSAGSSLEIVLGDVLKTAGLDVKKDVTLSYSGNGTATSAILKAGRVDGAVTGFPFVTENLMEKRIVLWIDPLANDIPELVNMDFTAMFTNTSLIKSNPGLVQRMVNAMAKSEAYIQTHKAESRTMLRQIFPSMKPEIADAAFDKLFPVFPKTPASSPDGFAKAQALMNKGLADKDKVNVKMDDLVDASFVKKALAGGK